LLQRYYCWINEGYEISNFYNKNPEVLSCRVIFIVASFPPAPIVWKQLIITFFYRSMPRGMVLWSAKVPKALCQSSNEPFAQSHAHQKNSGTSFNQVL